MTTSEMWSGQRSMLILFGVVCGILCGISDLSGVDRKSVRRMGNYGNEVSLSCNSDTHLQRLTGHRVNTTSKQCAVPGVQDIWQIQANTCEHRSNTSIEILIYAVTWTFDYHVDIGDDENVDPVHEYLYSGSVFVRIRHSPDWNRGNACAIAFIIFFRYHSLSVTQRIRRSALMYAGWKSVYSSVEVIMLRLLIVILVPFVCVQYILTFHMCA